MIDIQLVLIKGKSKYDITELTESVSWSGKKGSAPRTLQFTIINDKNFHEPFIDIEDGWHVIFKTNGSERFRGIILRVDDTSSSKKATYKAYDVGIYLANNKDTFSFKNKTATQIFKSICKRFGLKTDTVVDTKYVIGELISQNKSVWDCLLSALSKTYKHTGVRYYIRAKNGKLSLLRRSDKVIDYIIETGVNVESYSQTKSLEKIVTRVVIYNDKNKLVTSAKDEDIENKIGIFQSVESYDDDKSIAQLKKLCKSTLDKNKKIQHTLTLTVCGNVNFKSGNCVKVMIRPLNISKKFYIDSDTHTFSASKGYLCQLSLNAYNEKEWK